MADNNFSSDKDFAERLNTKNIALSLGVDESLVIDDLNMSPLEKEQNIYTKSDLSNIDTQFTLPEDGGSKIDEIPVGQTREFAGCMLSATEETYTDGALWWSEEKIRKKIHVKSDYLGEFDYDPTQFSLGYKSLSDGTMLPVLKYTGREDGGVNFKVGNTEVFQAAGVSEIEIPEGLKVMDYMFENSDTLTYVPKIPQSVTSMHYSFVNCKSLKFSVDKTHAAAAGHIADIFNKDKNTTSFSSIAIPEWENSPVLMPSVVYLPENLEDMSGAFKGCDKLQTAFSTFSQRKNLTAEGSNLPKSILNLSDTWNGCFSLEKVNDNSSIFAKRKYSAFPQYGKNITPYLTSTYAVDALTVDNEEAKKQVHNTEYTIDSSGKVADDVDTSEMDKDKLQNAQVASKLHYDKDVNDGKVASDVELASGGSMTHNYIYNAKDDKIQDDISGLCVSDPKPSSLASLWQQVAIDGAVGFTTAAVVSKVTKNSLVGTVVGAVTAIGLDCADLIPESFLPIAQGLRDMLPEGKIRDKLSEFCDKMAPSTIEEQQKWLTADNIAMSYQNRRLQKSVESIGIATDFSDFGKINEYMYENAEYCGKNLSFKATADKAMSEGEDKATAGAKEVIHTSLNSIEEFWNENAVSDNGESTVSMQDMRDCYVGVMGALEEYNKGAKHGIMQINGSVCPDGYRDASYQGLEMLNRAYADEVMDSLKRMDDTYHFMNEETWEKIQSMDISGVDIANIRTYDGSGFKAQADTSVMSMKEIMAKAGESYNIGTEVKLREGQSFYNENNGQFKNENNPNQETTNKRVGIAQSELGDVVKNESESEEVKEEG